MAIDTGALIHPENVLQTCSTGGCDEDVVNNVEP